MRLALNVRIVKNRNNNHHSGGHCCCGSSASTDATNEKLKPTMVIPVHRIHVHSTYTPRTARTIKQ